MSVEAFSLREARVAVVRDLCEGARIKIKAQYQKDLAEEREAVIANFTRSEEKSILVRLGLRKPRNLTEAEIYKRMHEAEPFRFSRADECELARKKRMGVLRKIESLCSLNGSDRVYLSADDAQFLQSWQ